VIYNVFKVVKNEDSSPLPSLTEVQDQNEEMCCTIACLPNFQLHIYKENGGTEKNDSNEKFTLL
jgi:hypothetical protein